jgi:hypothetical protein
MTDRLTLTRAFEGAGLKSGDAERLASEIYDAIHDNVATKQDLERVEAGLKADLARVEATLKADLARIEAALRAETKLLGERLERRVDNMVVRLGAPVVIVAGLLFGALHYWPPRG